MRIKENQENILKVCAIFGLVTIVLFVSPVTSFAATGVGAGVLIREKVKKKAESIVIDVIQDNGQNIIETVTKPVVHTLVEAVKSKVFLFKINTFVNNFLFFNKEPLTQAIERIVVPENFQIVTRGRIHPVLTLNEIAVKTTTIGGTILALRGGGLGSNIGTWLTSQVWNKIASSKIEEKIWDSFNKPVEKEEKKKFQFNELQIPANLIPVTLTLAVLVFLFGNPPEDIVIQEPGKTKRYREGLVQKGKRGLARLKSVFFGEEISPEKKVKPNHSSFYEKLMNVTAFLLQHKVYSALTLISFFLFFFGRNMFKDNSIFKYAVDAQNGVFKYTEKLFNRSVNEMKTAYGAGSDILKVNLGALQKQYDEQVDKVAKLQNQVLKLTQDVSECGAKATIFANTAEIGINEQAQCLVSLNRANEQLASQIQQNFNNGAATSEDVQNLIQGK